MQFVKNMRQFDVDIELKLKDSKSRVYIFYYGMT